MVLEFFWQKQEAEENEREKHNGQESDYTEIALARQQRFHFYNIIKSVINRYVLSIFVYK